jgi:hypothetical protein
MVIIVPISVLKDTPWVGSTTAVPLLVSYNDSIPIKNCPNLAESTTPRFLN